MNKIWLIIKREYLTRVRKKTFILTTILTPLLFAGIFAVVIFITIKNVSNEKVAVVDSGGYLKSSLESSKTVTYEFVPDVDTSNFIAKGYSAVLFAPQTGINQTSNFKLITEKSLNRIANTKIERDISRALENNMISQELKIDPKQIDSIKSRAENISIETSKKGEGGKLESSSFDVANGIGYITGFLIYITLFIYGTMVMRGVMEEKTNRIAEVMVSSIRPFQLMLGKIIGISLVALTQFLLWIVFVLIIYNITTNYTAGGDMMSGMVGSIQKVISNINVPLILLCFGFYLLGGFFFYSSLYAAIGSAVNEDMREAQSLSFPITMLVIFSIALMAPVISDPTGDLAFWASIIPFSSPIVMMARIPFGVPGTVPYWQLGLSMGLLILGFIFTTWFAGKIYRTGILMYGKKPSWKEMLKWAFRK